MRADLRLREVRPSGSTVLRLLLVQDSEADTTRIVHALSTDGRLVRFHRVETEEAFTTSLSSAPWDVIVSDWGMPRFSAMEALRALQKSGRDVPFVIVSGALLESDAVAAMRAGAHHCLLKDALARLAPVVERECAETAQRAARREADAALRRSETDLRAVMAQVPDGLLTVNSAGSFATLNPAAERIFGTRAEDVVGHPAEELLPPGFAQWMGQGSRDCEGRRIDGTMLQLEIAVAPVQLGEPRLVVSVRDVTDRKRLEAEVQRSQKMETVGMLAGGVAHDFNNVLTGIQSAAALAGLELPADHAAQADLGEIERQCQRAGALVRQLLAFARKQPMKQRTLALNTVALDLESLLRRVLGANVALTVVLEPDLCNVTGDPAQLEQVLMNLCVNARDAMPSGGRLTVRTSNVEAEPLYAERHGTVPGKRLVQLEVEDTGTGIAPRTLERIFEPFFTTKAPGRGTGLGLAVVHGIVRQHQGTIEVTSAPGMGSNFVVRMPAVTEAADARPAASAAPVQTGSGTLLLVEDDAPVRQGLARLLERTGYRVVQAADAEEALAVADAVRPDLIVLDAVLPGLAGSAAHRAMRGRFPGARILLVSGAPEGTLDVALRGELGDDFLQKPFTLPELADRVARMLAPGEKRARA